MLKITNLYIFFLLQYIEIIAKIDAKRSLYFYFEPFIYCDVMLKSESTANLFMLSTTTYLYLISKPSYLSSNNKILLFQQKIDI